MSLLLYRQSPSPTCLLQDPLQVLPLLPLDLARKKSLKSTPYAKYPQGDKTTKVVAPDTDGITPNITGDSIDLSNHVSAEIGYKGGYLEEIAKSRPGRVTCSDTTKVTVTVKGPLVKDSESVGNMTLAEDTFVIEEETDESTDAPILHHGIYN